MFGGTPPGTRTRNLRIKRIQPLRWRMSECGIVRGKPGKCGDTASSEPSPLGSHLLALLARSGKNWKATGSPAPLGVSLSRTTGDRKISPENRTRIFLHTY